MVTVLGVINEQKITIQDFPIVPKNIAAMINMINDGTISSKIAKDVFDEMLKTREDPKIIVEKKGWLQVSDEAAVEKVVDEVLKGNPEQVKKYLSGKEQVFGFFVGQIMRAMQGKGNPKVVNEILKRKLDAMNRTSL